MAHTDKDIVIVPNKGNANGDPFIVFTGANANNSAAMTVVVYPDANGTLSVEASAGQLFSITNDLDTDLFVVNNKFAQSLIKANADGTILFNSEVTGNASFGTGGKKYNLEVKDVVAITKTSVPSTPSTINRLQFNAPWSTGNTIKAATIQTSTPNGWSSNATHKFTKSELTFKVATNESYIDPPYWYNQFGDFVVAANTEYGSGVGFDSGGNLYAWGGTDQSNTWPVLAKFEPSGNLVWQKYLSKSDYPGSYSYAEGFSVSPSGNSYITIPYYGGYNSVGVAKIGSNGNLIWQNEIAASGTSTNIVAISTALDSSENVYALSVYYGEPAGSSSLIVFKYDLNGNLIWSSSIERPGGLQAYGNMVADSTGNVAISFYVSGSTARILKLNGLDGSIIWATKLDSIYFAFDVTVDEFDNFYIATQSYVSGYLAFVAKLDSNGTLLWLKYLNYNSSYNQSIVADNGYVYVSGTSSINGEDYIISKLDYSGNVIWIRNFGSPQNDYMWYDEASKAIAIKNDAYAITGYSRKPSGGPYNFTILRAPIDGSGTGTYGGYSYSEFPYSYVNTTSTTTNVVSELVYTPSPAYATANATPAGLVAYNNDFTSYLVKIEPSGVTDALKLDSNGNIQIYGTIIDASGSYGSANQVLTFNGTKAVWANSSGGGAVDPAALAPIYDQANAAFVKANTGSTGNTLDAQILFNDANTINGSPQLVFYKSNNTLTTSNLTVSGTTTLINANTITVSNLNITGTTVYLNANNFTVNETEVNSIIYFATTVGNKTVDAFANTFRSAKYFVSMNAGTDYQSTEISIIHNDVDSFMTEYGTVQTSANNLATFSTAYISGTIMINANPTFANTNFKMFRTATKR